jgi:hypothetical protein
MKRGDLLFVKPDDPVQPAPGSRYSQGIVVEEFPQFNAVKVVWCDLFSHLEDIEPLEKHYARITNETR